MAGRGHRRLTYGSSRRKDGVQAFWSSCQSDDESEKRRTNPKRQQTLRLRYHIEALLFDTITDHATRSNQPAPLEIPTVVPGSPDSFELIHAEHPDDEMDVQESIDIPLVEAVDAPRKQNATARDKPLGLLDLPSKVRKQILKIALKEPKAVAPFYHTGCVELAEHLVTKPNIDISLLLVNKQLHAEAADALYGANAFRFSNPQLALWWFRHIGPTNVSRIRTAYFIMDSFDHMNFYVREERLWQNVFTWLEQRQNFQVISLSFERWNEEGMNWMTDFDIDRVESARDGSMRALFKFRGLQSVKIRPGTFLNRGHMDDLSQAMMLPKK